MTARKHLRIAILGAGASGLMALIRLIEAGHRDVTVFEKEADLGGTWRDNRYPGLTCDVPSHAYRYSFEPNAEWTQLCATGSEILQYLRNTVRKYRVEGHIHYEREVTRAAYAAGLWHLETKAGDEGTFHAVITATGVLHHPVYPDIPGIERFQGRAFHSARWADDVSLEDTRLGVIGTGSTAIQLTSAAIREVEHLTLFQRTAQWVVPFENREITEEEKREYRTNPQLLEDEYLEITGKLNTNFAAAVVGQNPGAYAKIVKVCEENLATVRDPELRRKLTPDYQVGCKRLVMSGEFYEAIQQPIAHLETSPIETFCKEGVRTADGKVHSLDVIVMATGFDTHKFFRPMQVIGAGGLALDDAWQERNESYMTVAAPGFPNWFMIGGPASPIGNFSWILTAETQFAYILQLIEKLDSGEASEIAPQEEATERFNESVRKQIPNTVWATGCTNWYTDKNGDIASWPWTFERFQEVLAEPRWEDFKLS